MMRFVSHVTTRLPSLRPKGNVGALAAVLASLCAGAAWATPATITASPSYDHPTAQVSVSGTGFGVSQAIDIYFDTTDVGLAVTNGSGAFNNVPINVPGSAVPGQHWITGVQRFKGRAAQTSFDVWTDWAQDKFDPKKKGYNPYENVIGTGNVSNLDVAWTYQTGIGGDVFNYPVMVADGTVYGVSYEGQVFALNGMTGTALWTVNLSGVVNGSPAVSGSNVFVCVGTTLYALNASNGQTAWTAPLAAGCFNTPAVANGNVFIGDASGYLYSFNGHNGAEIWAADIGADFASPAVANGNVYITTGRSIYAVSATYGSTVWSRSPNNGAPVGTPAVANGNIFVTTTAGDLIDCDAATGYTWFETNYTSSPIYSSPVVGPSPYGPLVYFADYTATLFAVVPISGVLEWQYNEPQGGVDSQTPAIANGIVYTTAGYGIYANDAVYGNVDWTALSDNFPGSLVVANGMVYMPSGLTTLYAYAINGGDDKAYKQHRSPPKISSLHPDYSLKPHYSTP